MDTLGVCWDLIDYIVFNVDTLIIMADALK